MEEKELCLKTLETGKKQGAQDIEVYYNHRKKMEVSIENNDIQVPKADIYQGLGIRVFVEGKMGFASTNVLEESSIKETIDRALSIAKNSPADPNNQLPEPVELEAVQGIYDEEGAQLALEKLIDKSRLFLETAREDKRVVIESASFSGDVMCRAMASSKGISAQEEKTMFVNMGIGFARDGDDLSSFDMEYQVDCHAEKIDPVQNARKLKEKVINCLGAESTKSFQGDIILTPFSAVNLILTPIVFAVNADNVQNGLSPWKDQLNKKVGASILRIMDNGSMPQAPGSRKFDREGLAPRPVDIIEEGVLLEYLHNNYTALKEGIKSNGHASGNDQSPPSVGPTNFIIAPGEISLEEMIGGIDRGILVNRYSGSADPVSGDFSGVVKGGHLIEGGKLVKPVKEVMIAGNVYDILSRITALSSDIKPIMNFRVPHVQVENISITGK